jgi:uncharacterized membrane protein
MFFFVPGTLCAIAVAIALQDEIEKIEKQKEREKEIEHFKKMTIIYMRNQHET